MNTTKLDTTTTPEQQAQVHAWRRPRYDVSESTDAFDVKVSMPGVTRDGVTISVDGESLSITGTRTHEAPKGWRPLRRELQEGDYRLNLRLNVAIKEAEIRAHVEDGVLDLMLPKADEVKPRKIRVS
ncbi:MAG TPA: Hsp20/alpha crystallin family protein [Opitutae bacterium]|jgi:HSP20 family protein|nr:Hsp20/alpha crystallin family protein [Opitutae bacterium]